MPLMWSTATGPPGTPRCGLTPVMLAAAEMAETPPSGTDMLAAVAVGYEVGMRSGMYWNRDHARVYTSGLWGAIGAVAAAGRILGLKEDVLLQALNCADYHGPVGFIARGVATPWHGQGRRRLGGPYGHDVHPAGTGRVHLPPAGFRRRAGRRTGKPLAHGGPVLQALLLLPLGPGLHRRRPQDRQGKPPCRQRHPPSCHPHLLQGGLAQPRTPHAYGRGPVQHHLSHRCRPAGRPDQRGPRSCRRASSPRMSWSLPT